MVCPPSDRIRSPPNERLRYRIAIIYVGADEAVVRARCKSRELKTGRGVPEAELVSSLAVSFKAHCPGFVPFPVSRFPFPSFGVGRPTPGGKPDGSDVQEELTTFPDGNGGERASSASCRAGGTAARARSRVQMTLTNLHRKLAPQTCTAALNPPTHQAPDKTLGKLTSKVDFIARVNNNSSVPQVRCDTGLAACPCGAGRRGCCRAAHASLLSLPLVVTERSACCRISEPWPSACLCRGDGHHRELVCAAVAVCPDPSLADRVPENAAFDRAAAVCELSVTPRQLSAMPVLRTVVAA